MRNRILIITGAVALIGFTYVLAMCAVPGKGWLKATEKLCLGIILSFLCSAVLKPFGFSITNSPLSAVTAGWWGLPGVALAAFLAHFP